MINVMGNYLSFLKLKIILAIHHPRLKESLPGSQNIISKKQTVDQVRCSSNPQYCCFLDFVMFCQGAGAHKRPLHGAGPRIFARLLSSLKDFGYEPLKALCGHFQEQESLVKLHWCIN